MKSNNFLRVFMLLSMSLLWASLGHSDEWAAIGEIVKVEANKAVRSMGDASNIPDPGRFYLLEEMLRAPAQLGRDYVGIPTITMKVKGEKETSFGREDRKDKTVDEVNDTIRQMLIEKIGKSNPEMVQKSEQGRIVTKLGKFWLSELIYPITQNFNAQAADIAIREIPGLNVNNINEFKYGPTAGAGSIRVEFEYDARNSVLSVSLISDKPYISLLEGEDNNPPIVLTTIGTTIFDLVKGKVTYKFSYAFGKKKREWKTDKPFLPQPPMAKEKSK